MTPGSLKDRSRGESIQEDKKYSSQEIPKSKATSDDLDTWDKQQTIASFSQWPSECATCQMIWHCFSRPDLARAVNLGFIKDALATPCRIHKPLVQAFNDYLRVREGEEPTFSRQEIGDLGLIPGDVKRSVHMTESISMLGRFWGLLLVKKDFVLQHPGTGRILNPDWVDMDVLKQWKIKCISTHGATCESPLKIWPKRPAYLVDVIRKCLVTGCDLGAFVALSYRYGRAPVPEIDAATLEKLQTPYALAAPEFEEFLSPVIRHAMYLTSIIHERYLWVDALCIPHADEDLRAEELNMMGAIYGNALVTIIAADGDAEDGLRGLQGVSTPRDMNQRVVPFGVEEIVVRNTGIFDLSGGNEYYSRAWTFQENRMSRRKIIFKKKELHWQCQCSVWHEELILNAETDKYIDLRQNVITAGFPDLGSLSHVLSNFNETKLRYDEDALPAISGLLSVFSRSFTGGFLYGIPEMFFERGLGWTPYWDHTNIRRRTVSERSQTNPLSDAGLPSWSWIGWQGLVNPFGYGEAARINERQNWIEETSPITTWYTGKCSSSTEENRRRIRSTWFENRDTYKDLTKPMPPGWSRHAAPVATCRGEPHLRPDRCDKFIFKHVAMPDPDMASWFYPFPVPDILESTPPVTPEQTSYLFCKTWTSRLRGRQASKGNTAELYNSHGENIGSLHLHNKSSLSLFPNADAQVDQGLPVDLVALYKSRVYRKTWNEDGKRYEHPYRKDDVFKVLWVEWKDGVAYRLASGKVDAREWEKLVPNTINLILG